MRSRVVLSLDEIQGRERVLLLFCSPSLSPECRKGMKFLGMKGRDKTKPKPERIPWKNRVKTYHRDTNQCESLTGGPSVTESLPSRTRWKPVYHHAITKIPKGWKWNSISGIPQVLHQLGFTLYEVGWQILMDTKSHGTQNLCRTIFHYEHTRNVPYSPHIGEWRNRMEGKLQTEFFEKMEWGIRGFVNEDPITGYMYVSLNFDSHQYLKNSRSSLNICRTKHS